MLYRLSYVGFAKHSTELPRFFKFLMCIESICVIWLYYTNSMIPADTLFKAYVVNKRSAKEIAQLLECSENKIHYWLTKHGIPKRTISEATYLRANPSGDPFYFNKPTDPQHWFLFGLGLGLYWGEGNKANTHAVRLGNCDPGLIRFFITFLREVYQIDQNRLKFGIQLFTDTNPRIAKKYWCKELKISAKQFHATTITRQNKPGSYRKKLQYGVLTVYFSNKKLRDTIVNAISELQNNKLPM